MIPQQLIDAGARVVLIRPLRKGTHVKNWGTTGNLSATDPDLISHLQRGGNYGVLSHNGVCMIDIDDPVKFRESEIKLPASFAVERGDSKRGHYYFTCNDCPDEYRTITDLGFGDIRLGGNHYVVGRVQFTPRAMCIM